MYAVTCVCVCVCVCSLNTIFYTHVEQYYLKKQKLNAMNSVHLHTQVCTHTLPWKYFEKGGRVVREYCLCHPVIGLSLSHTHSLLLSHTPPSPLTCSLSCSLSRAHVCVHVRARAHTHTQSYIAVSVPLYGSTTGSTYPTLLHCVFNVPGLNVQ